MTDFVPEAPTSTTPSQVREAMKNYWTEHSKKGSNMENMLLDSNAEAIDSLDRPEILSLLPDYSGKDVLELAAGIGRFTGSIASKAGSVVAVEFMDSFLEKNKELNSHYGNISFECADVLHSNYTENSFDIVFSCWLNMYLDDTEIIELAQRSLRWVKPGGYVFMRESCFRQSGNAARTFNPSRYRSPQHYYDLYTNTSRILPNGEVERFELVRCKNLETYMEVKGNKSQLCWLWRKVSSQGGSYTNFQEFLDNEQYSRNGILRYERMFGEGFVSAGGIETTREFVNQLDLQPGQRVLDVGCGVGGGAFYMATTYEARVHGIDLSTNMVHLAYERATQTGKSAKNTFEIVDATWVEYPQESYDIIYSRDVIQHIPDKASLFNKFYRWLRPGGKILITDGCKGAIEWSPESQAYVQRRGYHFLNIQEYKGLLEEAGFENVVAEDRTDQFVGTVQQELERVANMREEFVRDFSEDDYERIVNGWRAKLSRCANEEQKWGYFFATKPF